MRLFSAVIAVGALLAGQAKSQQYAGEVIDTGLPNVPGSEIAFFKIPGVMDSNKKKAANLTLINYYSHGSDGKRLVESKVQRAVIVVHGLNRDPQTYESNMLSALAQVTGDSNINKDSVAVMAPYFANGDDKRTGYPWTDGLAAQRGSTTSALVWKSSQWSAGANNQYPYYSQTTSSFTVLDTIVQYFDDRTLFPNMKQIIVAGHSLGAQTVQRYAAIGQQLGTKSPVTYWIGNPNSYVWLSTDRPLPTASCPSYDDYRDGFTKFTEYPMTYGQSLVSQGRSAIIDNYQSKQIAYARGTLDLGDDSSSCAPYTAGGDRNERFFNFIKAFPASCSNPSSNCDTVDLVNMGHDAGGMFASPAGRARLFTDNFYGNGNRSYDFGYPRQVSWDDPYPDPALNTSSSSVNNNTYAGNMTYAGCWTDSGSIPSMPTKAYENSSNTIELCTSTCVAKGFSIAGLEFGSQCYCGNYMTSEATQVIESSCSMACAGNSSETCGSGKRLSVFSNGEPTVLPPPSAPETVGNFSYSNCYTEAPTGSRALAGKSTSGSFMTLEYCASFCASYKYFGTEYSSECYCGNTIHPNSSIALAADCSMTCANNNLEYCGAGNRLTLYTNPDWTGTTSSSTVGSTTVGSSTSAPSPTDTGSSLACPAANNTIVVSQGLNFTVECGIDHLGGDLSSLYVSNFQQCIDACATNSKCVDVSLSGTACYLKSTLGAAVNSASIWGAKLVTNAGSSSSSSASSTVSVSSSSAASVSGSTTSTAGTASSVLSTSSTSASASASPLSCPASNGTTYTAASSQKFVIECGIDHQGGDMGSKYVNNLQECIDVCDATSGCVDVSLSGTACYMKNKLGTAVAASYVLGAKLVDSSVSSTLVATSSSSSAIYTTSSSLASGSASLTVSTASTTSSTASASATAVSCPSSDGTTYTLTSGNSFLIECGIDHQAGDLSSKPVKSFAECIAACDSTSGCVVVSMSGDMCYLKSSVGPVVRLDYVWGARLLPASSSSSSVSSSATVSSTASSDLSSSTETISSSSSTSQETVSTASSTSTAESSSSSSSASTAAETEIASSTPSVSSTSATSTEQSTSATTQSASSNNLDVPTTSTSSQSSSSAAETSSSSASENSSTVSESTSTSAASSSTSSITSETSTSSSGSDIASSTSSSASDVTTSSNLEPSSTTSSSASDVTSSSSSSSQVSSTSSSASDITSSSEVPSTSSIISLTSQSSSTSSGSETTSSSASQVSSTASASEITTSSSILSSSSSQGFSTSSGLDTTSASSTSSSSSSSSSQTSATASESIVSSTSSVTSSSTSAVPTTSSTAISSSSSVAASSTGSSAASLPTGFSYAGCFVDSSSKRALPVSIGSTDSQTQQQCAMKCQAQGYKYSGTEYGSECWCGNNLPSSSAPESQCNMPCKGDSTQKCGAGARLSVVTDDSWKQTFFARQSFESWNLMGCYTDSTAKRSLPNSVSLAAYGGGAKASISNCVQACQAKGYTYCGAEYYSECFGSNSPPASALASGSTDPLVAGCNYPCKGNQTESCGGSARIIVYTTNVQ